MNLDIVSTDQGYDMGMAVTDVSKAKNVLSIQLGALEYAAGFGVDMEYFLTQIMQFQNESFKSYLVQRLTENQINVSSVIQTVETLFLQLGFKVGDNTGDVKGYVA